jgi:hypothetical protein
VRAARHEDQALRPVQRGKDTTRVIRRRVDVRVTMNQEHGDVDGGGRTRGADGVDIEMSIRGRPLKRASKHASREKPRRALGGHGPQV